MVWQLIINPWRFTIIWRWMGEKLLICSFRVASFKFQSFTKSAIFRGGLEGAVWQILLARKFYGCGQSFSATKSLSEAGNFPRKVNATLKITGKSNLLCTILFILAPEFKFSKEVSHTSSQPTNFFITLIKSEALVEALFSCSANAHMLPPGGAIVLALLLLWL